MKNLITYLIIAQFVFPSFLSAQEDCLPETTNRLFNDFTNTISQSDANQLESTLIQFSNSTSTQIVILIVKDLCGYDKASYTYSVGDKWQVGQKGKDNGVVIMVKPKEIDGRGETFIATGYGLEAVIPDAIGKRIVENEMIPRFKQKDYYGGLVAATDVIMKLAEGEFSAEEYNRKSNREEIIFPIIFFAFVIMIIIFSRINGARKYARKNDTSLWLALMLMSSSSGRRGGGGGFGGFSSGGGSFGGFGGGSFGGGGAGGSW